MTNSYLSKLIAAAKLKPLWAIAALLSTIYAVTFFGLPKDFFKDPLLFGFCVWCSPDFPICPSESEGCTKCDYNSHLIGAIWQVPALAAALIIYFKDAERNIPRNRLVYFGIIATIILHGLLHWYLQNNTVGPEWFKVNCFREDFGPLFKFFGYIVFSTICFIIPYTIFNMGFEEDPTFPKRNLSILILLVIFSITFVKSINTIFAALFAIVHPLMSYVALFSSQIVFDNNVFAAFFIMATIAGLMELYVCPQFYQKIGGHVWFDFILPFAQLSAAPYFNKIFREYFSANKKKE